jgi:hypothetical protein
LASIRPPRKDAGKAEEADGEQPSLADGDNLQSAEYGGDSGFETMFGGIFASLDGLREARKRLARKTREPSSPQST